MRLSFKNDFFSLLKFTSATNNYKVPIIIYRQYYAISPHITAGLRLPVYDPINPEIFCQFNYHY